MEKEVSFGKKLLSLFLPIAVQNLIMALVSATDALVLGLIDQSALSAVSLATQIDFIMNLFIGAIVGGTMILASQYYGKGDYKNVERLFATSLRYTGIISILFFIAAFFAPKMLMRIYTSDFELIEIGARYLKVVSFSYLLTGFSKCYICIMKLSGRSLKSTVIALVAVVFDVTIDIILVFGFFGFPQMGAEGVAASTVVVSLAELILVIWDSYIKDHIRPTIKSMKEIVGWLEKDFWGVTVHSLINSLVWGIGFSSYSAIMGHLGSDAVAANSIASVIKELVSCFCMGLGTGAEIMIAHELGKNNLKKAKEYGSRLAKLSLLCGAVSAVVLLLISPVILKYIALTETAGKYLRQMLVVCAVYLFAKSVNVIVVCGIFAAGGDTKYDAKSVIFSMWFFAIPLGAIAAFWLKLPVIWVYLIVSSDEIVKIPWIYPRYKKYLWLKNLTKEENNYVNEG